MVSVCMRVCVCVCVCVCMVLIASIEDIVARELE